MNRYQAALEDQGFEQPYDESPIALPDGWHHGAVDQTGGMIMVRRWVTCVGLSRVHETCPGDDVEYEVAYGSNPGVSLQRYEWRADAFSDGTGCYEFAGEVESIPVDDNTDAAKTQAAKELMEQHDA